MSTLTSPKYLKSLLSRHGFSFSKSLGQNFLIDENILNKIVQGAQLASDDYVLEIGPGVGTLTAALARHAAKVVAVEIDRSLKPILDETLEGFNNVEVVYGDILKLDLEELTKDRLEGRPFKIVANLPYYITTPIIMRFLENDCSYTSITVMIQQEVAARMAAGPGSKEYGALSVAVQFYTRPRLICKVPASVFLPPPKVGSIVIALDRRNKPAVDVEDTACFFKIVRAVFAQRRKTLLNNLVSAGITGLDKAALSQKLSRLGIDPERRGETLSLEELALISNNIDCSDAIS
ncbi:MAG: 16S rRNA (adenine(1518)-N(6)/adenine(1519)-N(6))-dimethyltransferase RsmA [Clostridiales bacterium]|jgi:16S rRNA (adenine1518-N6/adenine1519-N6)-dimethyltransferase|nr:16S rRNA (adenine(1518)-N(6)/adenine(1519)-N(6))-dimethyltransferase RsmA [Clostridiales bacterium]